MRNLSRCGSCVALAGVLLLAASVALAEQRKPVQSAPATKVRPPEKAITVDQDLMQPSMARQKGAKTTPPEPQGKR